MLGCAIITHCRTRQSHDNVTHQDNVGTYSKLRLFLSDFWMHDKRHNLTVTNCKRFDFQAQFSIEFPFKFLHPFNWRIILRLPDELLETGIICSYFSAWIRVFSMLCEVEETRGINYILSFLVAWFQRFYYVYQNNLRVLSDSYYKWN